MQKETKEQDKGFTLIELLVVIAIIALLASVVIVSVSAARAKSRDAKRIADLNQFVKGLELYFNENRSYPTTSVPGTLNTLVQLGQPPMVPNYLNKIPVSPIQADGNCSVGPGAGSNQYYMYANSTGASQPQTNTYVITFCLGAKTGALSGGPHTLTNGGFQ
jgi:prepilin-type N-terminal cleavage/methylation domain-containing protein